MATKKRTPDFVIEADVEKSTREQDLPAARRTPVPKPRFALVLVLALAASVAVALTACGGDDNKSSTSNSSPSSTSGSATKAAGTGQPADATKPGQTVGGKLTDACQLLTKEDASAALGAKDLGTQRPTARRRTTSPRRIARTPLVHRASCRWPRSDPPRRKRATISRRPGVVLVRPSTWTALAKRLFMIQESVS